MSSKNLGVGCLPLFILVFILMIIRFWFAPSQTWEKGFTDLTVFLYWVGILYMILVVIINKVSEPTKHPRDEWKNKEMLKGKNERAALVEYEKSEYYARKDELDNVIFHLTNAINLNPIGKYYGSRGIYKKSKKDFDGAIEDLNKAISLLPESSLYWYCRADVYFTKGNQELAYKNWKKAEELGSIGAKNVLDTHFKNYNTNINKEESAVKSDSNLKLLRDSWAKYNERLILNNDTLWDLLNENKIESINYNMLLRCFEWKFKRFKILVRDNFQCQDCKEKSSELHVHHNYYIKDSMPWEIEDSALTSLCRNCHSNRHEKDNIYVYRKFNGQLIITSHYYLRCPRCNGTGYLPQFKHVEDGICFLCHGSVISETIFSDRLKTIKSQKEKYDIRDEKFNLEKFMNSITMEYFSSQINEKILNEMGDFYLGDYDNNQGRNKKSNNNFDTSYDSSDDLPF